MQQPKAALEILNGWKEIASHLGKGVRTVQRYERELGLPIRRPAGKFTGSVMATRAELDAWVSASPVRLSFPVSQVITDHIATLTELKLRIAEMRRLRRETEELREQLRATGELLNVSLRRVLPGETQVTRPLSAELRCKEKGSVTGATLSRSGDYIQGVGLEVS